MRKVVDGIAIASGIGLLAIFGSGAYGYFWFQNNKDTLKQDLIEQVSASIKVPSLSGPAMPAPNKSFSPPKF